ASLMILGALAPVVFAEEPTKITQESNGNEDEKLKPLVWNISLYPESRDEEDWFNENTLYHRNRELYYIDPNNDGRRTERLFIRIDFTVDEGELTFPNINNLIAGVGVYSDNSNISMVDVDFLNEIHNMTTNNENTGKNEQKEFIDRYI
ncbi:hypothetical protein, partial [Stenotrophomonas maltophilia group sp. RNC7]|uniref:hypothetical protein n=1 Tax=Stenotrophomonas maltophilia group sp. RNC7 TaxID=3071467 RepID=UPI0027E1B941